MDRSRRALLNVAKVAWNQAYEATDNLENRSFDRQPVLRARHALRQHLRSRASTRSGPTRNTPTFVDLKSLQFIDNLTWSRGSHNVKTGFSFTHYMNDQDSSFDFGGIYAFTSLENFVLNRPGTYEGQAPGSTTARRWRQNLIGLYAQDDWTARRNLTLNLGVRYEFITTPHELDGRDARCRTSRRRTSSTGGDRSSRTRR